MSDRRVEYLVSGGHALMVLFVVGFAWLLVVLLGHEVAAGLWGTEHAVPSANPAVAWGSSTVLGVAVVVGGVAVLIAVMALLGALVEEAGPRLAAWHDHLWGGDDEA